MALRLPHATTHKCPAHHPHKQFLIRFFKFNKKYKGFICANATARSSIIMGKAIWSSFNPQLYGIQNNTAQVTVTAFSDQIFDG